MWPTIVGFHCKITYNNCSFFLRVELCQQCVGNCCVHGGAGALHYPQYEAEHCKQHWCGHHGHKPVDTKWCTYEPINFMTYDTTPCMGR